MASGIYAGPIDLLVGRKKLTLEERARRLAEGHCLYYSRIGHVACDCSNAQRYLLRATEGTLVLHNYDPATTAAAAAAENATHLN